MGGCCSKQRREEDYKHGESKEKKHKQGDKIPSAGASSQTQQPRLEGKDKKHKQGDNIPSAGASSQTQQPRREGHQQQPILNKKDTGTNHPVYQQTRKDKKHKQGDNIPSAGASSQTQQPRREGHQQQPILNKKDTGTNHPVYQQTRQHEQPFNNIQDPRPNQHLHQQPKRQGQQVELSNQNTEASSGVGRGDPPTRDGKQAVQTDHQRQATPETGRRDQDKSEGKSKDRKAEDKILRSRITVLEERVHVLEKEKNDLILRLSAFVSAKMTDGNADIADLSDQNRPTNIAVQYQEVYDNQWSDTFAHLTFKCTENEAIKILRDILVASFGVCSQKVREYWLALRPFSKDDTISVTIKKELKDGLKRNFLNGQATIRETALGEIKEHANLKHIDSQELTTYINSVIDVTWLMVIQDPPLWLDQDTLSRENDLFDKRFYREYTASGDTVEFVVWPALFVSKDGALLSKGTAQGKKSVVSDQKQLNADFERKQDTEKKLKQPSEVVQLHSNGQDKRHDKTAPNQSRDQSDTIDYDNVPPKQQVQKPEQVGTVSSSVSPIHQTETSFQGTTTSITDMKSGKKYSSKGTTSVNKIEVNDLQRNSSTGHASHQTNTSVVKRGTTSIHVSLPSQQGQKDVSSVHTAAGRKGTRGPTSQHGQKVSASSVHAAADGKRTWDPVSKQGQEISVHTQSSPVGQNVQKTTTVVGTPSTQVTAAGNNKRQEKHVDYIKYHM